MDTLYEIVRQRFPVAAEKADIEHVRLYEEVDPEMDALWFESLANAINYEMNNLVPAENYKDLLEFMSIQFDFGSEYSKKLIDVSFVENLFWRVPGEKTVDYWRVMPGNLKELYVNFHGCDPLPL